ncbi:hypothetical protein BC831DRAFT_479377 [Entophlyctis helioformis]|nr:hypothetical protein BC831DRAFT_479377 [Entophlyctis helioformis]
MPKPTPALARPLVFVLTSLLHAALRGCVRVPLPGKPVCRQHPHTHMPTHTHMHTHLLRPASAWTLNTQQQRRFSWTTKHLQQPIPRRPRPAASAPSASAASASASVSASRVGPTPEPPKAARSARPKRSDLSTLPVQPAKQCTRQRWTAAETELLHNLVQVQRLRFKDIVPHFPNRTVVALYQFWHRTTRVMPAVVRGGPLSDAEQQYVLECIAEQRAAWQASREAAGGGASATEGGGGGGGGSAPADPGAGGGADPSNPADPSSPADPAARNSSPFRIKWEAIAQSLGRQSSNLMLFYEEHMDPLVLRTPFTDADDDYMARMALESLWTGTPPKWVRCGQDLRRSRLSVYNHCAKWFKRMRSVEQDWPASEVDRLRATVRRCTAQGGSGKWTADPADWPKVEWSAVFRSFHYTRAHGVVAGSRLARRTQKTRDRSARVSGHNQSRHLGPPMRPSHNKLPGVLALATALAVLLSTFSCLVAAIPTPATPRTAGGNTTAGTHIADRYIVVVQDWVSDKVIADHVASVQQVLSGKLPGASASASSSASLFPDDPATLISDLVGGVSIQSSTDGKAKPFKGVLGRYSSAVRGYHGELPTNIVSALRASRYVKMVEEDRVVTSQITVNAKIQLNPVWGLDRLSHTAGGYQGQYKYIAQAGANVDVYVLDTGVFVGHPDFGGRAVNGAVFTGDGSSDVQGHGTHVAGTIGSATYGVAKSVNIVAVKVLGNSGSGSTSGVIAGIDWVTKRDAATPRRSVVNMSLGGGGTSVAMNAAIATAAQRGVAFAVAAGNENADACGGSPANSPWVDRRASFSNYGTCVGIFAPGVGIQSTSNTGGVRTLSGTSMATPHVAGQLAVLLSVFPNASVLSLYRYIQQISTVNVLTNLGPGDTNRLLNNALLQSTSSSKSRSTGAVSSQKLDSPATIDDVAIVA